MDIFCARRSRLLASMMAMGGGVAVIPTASERERNRGTNFPYRADSHFFYLCGFREPEAVLVLIVDGGLSRQFLFCRTKDEQQETWTGFRYGPEAAADLFGFDSAWPIDMLDRKLPELLINQPALWTSLASEPEWDRRIFAAIKAVRAKARSGDTAPDTVHEISAMLDEMRLIKDESEIAIMRRAGEISAAAHCRAMRIARPDRYEYEIEAALLHAFRAAGSQFPAYQPIVASGPNACVLHYTDNNRRMQDGELLLIDAGCELDGYASDITRTFPVNSRFYGPQRDLYQLVLAANHAARAKVCPGNDWNAPHEAAVAVLTQGFIDLGLLKGEAQELIQTEAYRRFYMHRTGHWLGMDVHDVGQYKTAGQWRPFVPGMALTIEPGCYVRPADDVPEAFWNTGIRIEDNALVTPDGCEILTESVPREIEGIEELMRDRSH
ncbi:MAG: aminopeptidase P N-terminal domain-containing protein [Betaproteobacteria bacterium]|nr:aminopeptidase P N-terminal domain-containing protein [Betaproteobacteria bacterium]